MEFGLGLLEKNILLFIFSFSEYLFQYVLSKVIQEFNVFLLFF